MKNNFHGVVNPDVGVLIEYFKLFQCHIWFWLCTRSASKLSCWNQQDSSVAKGPGYHVPQSQQKGKFFDLYMHAVECVCVLKK